MEFSNINQALKATNDIPARLAYWDKDEICRFANTAYFDWFGKTQADMVDKISLKELLGSTYKENLPFIKEVLNGNLQSFEHEVTCPNGDVCFLKSTYTPDLVNGIVKGFTAHVSDITDFKRLEISLAKSEKRLLDILESTPDAMVIINSTGKLQMVNQQAENAFGYTSSELLGKDIEHLIPEALRSNYKAHIKNYFNSTSVRFMEKSLQLQGKRKNGETFSIEVSLSPAHSADETLVLASIRDVSERVREDAELVESNKQNSIFIEQAPNAIAMVDNEMRYIAASQKWMEDYNIVGQDIIGVSHYDVFPEIGDDWKTKHQQCLKGKIDQCDEAIFDRADGTRQWITWNMRPWYISEAEIGGLLMYTADITRIKEKDLEKRKIEEILDKTNEIAGIGTWEVNLETGKVFWSRITRLIHEVSADFDPDVEAGIEFYKEGDSRDRITIAVTEAIEKGTHFDLEVELITKNGNTVWVRTIGQAEFTDGKCVRLYGVFQDINAVKMAEIQLNKANEELRVIFNSGSISIIGTDTNGIITHFNHGAKEMLQYTAAEMIGKQSVANIHLKEEMEKRQKEMSAQSGRNLSGFDVFVDNAKAGIHEVQDWTYVRKDGSTFSVLLVISALRNPQGEITGFLGMATDVNERVENQRKLVETKKDLESLAKKLTLKNARLANFAHITSHNLRAPVTNLNSLLQLHQSSDSEEEKEVVFEMLEKVILHLSETLNTLVDALKIRDEGKKESELVKFDDVLNKTKEIIVAQIMDTDAEITADFSAIEDIEYNRGYLESIFLNLLTNAIKYKSPEKSPIIKLKTEVIRDRIVFTITDNGLGIDLKKHGSKLFGLHKTFHRHKESKGVGLYLTRNHIEAMGGVITVESEVDKGTKFIIKF